MTTTSGLPANEVGASMMTDNFNSTSPKPDATKTLLMARLPASMIQPALRVRRFIVSAPGRNEVRERRSIFTAIDQRIN